MESLASSMGVCSQKSFHCRGAGLSLRLLSLQASEPAAAACGHVHWGAEGPLHEVFCTGNVCAHTGFTCFAVTVIAVVFLEGVVVLKGDSDSGFSHWLCIACCHFHMAPNIWNTFDVPLGTLILSPLILLK